MSDNEVAPYSGQYPSFRQATQALSECEIRFSSIIANQVSTGGIRGALALELAGFPPPHTEERAQAVLAREAIQGMISRFLDEAAELAMITPGRVLKEMARIAFSNVKDLYKSDGTPKPLEELTRAQAASIAQIEVVNDDQGNVIAHRYKLFDKKGPLDVLGKHFGLWDGDGKKTTAKKSIAELARLARGED